MVPIGKRLRTCRITITAEVEKLLEADGEPPIFPPDELLLTPRTKTAIKTATDLPVETVGCEHILIALLFDPDSVAHQVLLSVGFTYDRLMATVNRINGNSAT